MFLDVMSEVVDVRATSKPNDSIENSISKLQQLHFYLLTLDDNDTVL